MPFLQRSAPPVQASSAANAAIRDVVRHHAPAKDRLQHPRHTKEAERPNSG